MEFDATGQSDFGVSIGASEKVRNADLYAPCVSEGVSSARTARRWRNSCSVIGQRRLLSQLRGAAARKVGERTVRCEERDIDRYGRIVAVCYLGGEDLNAWMVIHGWAVAFRRYSIDYVDEEEKARQAHRGIWQGEFLVPWGVAFRALKVFATTGLD